MALPFCVIGMKTDLFQSLIYCIMGFLGGSVVKKNPLANGGATGDTVQSLGQEDPLEEEMAIHSSIFAWVIS